MNKIKALIKNKGPNQEK